MLRCDTHFGAYVSLSKRKRRGRKRKKNVCGGGGENGFTMHKRRKRNRYSFSQGRVLMRERLGVRLRKAGRDVRLSWPHRLVCVVVGGPPKDGSWGSYTLCVFSNTPLAVLGPQGLSVLCVFVRLDVCVCVSLLSEPEEQTGVGRTLHNPSHTAGGVEETLRRHGRSTSERSDFL